MNPALAALALVTIAGALLALAARDVRATLLGVLVVLLGAPLIADPWPSPLAVLARIAATLLAVRLLGIGLRGDLTTSGSRIGWPAESLLAAAGAVVGFGSHGLGAPGFGPAEAQAAGFALIAIAIAPLATGRDLLRIALAALFLIVGAGLVRTGLGAPARDAEQLIWAVLTIALGGAAAVIAAAARVAGSLEVPADRSGREARLPDAHRVADPPSRPVASRPPALPSQRARPGRAGVRDPGRGVRERGDTSGDGTPGRRLRGPQPGRQLGPQPGREPGPHDEDQS